MTITEYNEWIQEIEAKSKQYEEEGKEVPQSLKEEIKFDKYDLYLMNKIYEDETDF